MKTISPRELSRKLEAQPDAVVIDVRPPVEFGAGGGAGLVTAGISEWRGMGLLLDKAPWNKRRPA